MGQVQMDLDSYRKAVAVQLGELSEQVVLLKSVNNMLAQENASLKAQIEKDNNPDVADPDPD